MCCLTLGGMEGEIVAILAVGGGLAVGIVSIIAGTVRSVVNRKHTEESRREIAAYVAEGSMSADDAAKLLAAGGTKDSKRSCG